MREELPVLRDGELTYRIRGCAFEVYRQLGHGFLESVYQKALVIELERNGLRYAEEQPIVIKYKGHEIAGFRLDLVIESKVIVELKAQRSLPLGAEAQLMNYLQATDLKTGLLINFAYPKATVKRIVL